MMNKFSVVAFSLLLSASALQAGGGPVSDDEDGCECGDGCVRISRPAKGQELPLITNRTSDEPLELMTTQNVITSDNAFHYGYHSGVQNLINHAKSLGRNLEIDETNKTSPSVTYSILPSQSSATRVEVMFKLQLIAGADIDISLQNKEGTQKLDQKFYPIPGNHTHTLKATVNRETPLKFVIAPSERSAFNLTALQVRFLKEADGTSPNPF